MGQGDKIMKTKFNKQYILGSAAAAVRRVLPYLVEAPDTRGRDRDLGIMRLYKAYPLTIALRTILRSGNLFGGFALMHTCAGYDNFRDQAARKTKIQKIIYNIHFCYCGGSHNTHFSLQRQVGH